MNTVLDWWIGLRLRNAMVFSVSVLVGLVAVCAITVHFSEGWAWIDSVYYSVVTLTTVGYGDFTPKNDSTKVFLIFYLPIAIAGLFVSLATMGAKLIELERRRLERAAKP